MVKNDSIIQFSELDGTASYNWSSIKKNLDDISNEIIEWNLLRCLKIASQVEHLLGMQYLFVAFSLKKFPEEFKDYVPNLPTYNTKLERSEAWEEILPKLNSGGFEFNEQEYFDQIAINLKRERQIEMIRRWEADVLYVSRQEMEHLCIVENMLAILDKDPYLWRPNFPVSQESNALGVPIPLMRFSDHMVDLMRYYEKPDNLDLPKPFPESVHEGEKVVFHNYKSIEQLYEYIYVFFKYLFDTKAIEGMNPYRVVNEHFGFNLELDPVIPGQYLDYVYNVIELILEQGEGVGQQVPDLGSHFMKFQDILNQLANEKKEDPTFDPALPVVPNPYILDNSNGAHYHLWNVKKDKAYTEHANAYLSTRITNKFTVKVMALFNDSYEVLTQMLYGFFKEYNFNSTQNTHPPKVNAYFRSSFYPWMTMVTRPLSEMLCRLPAFEEYNDKIKDGFVLPEFTAGPAYEFKVEQGPGNGAAKRKITTSPDNMEYFIARFLDFSARSHELAVEVKNLGYHVANYQTKNDDGRDFPVQFEYLSQNFKRIAENFKNYWENEEVNPIPSKNFTNYSNPFN